MTIASASGVRVQPSVFLDTNVLVRLFQFWDTCTTAKVQLDAVSDWGELKTALESADVVTDALNKTDAQFVKDGMKLFQHLKADDGYLYFSSQVCWSELHHVLLEARGLEHLIRQRVPHSLRVKRPQVLFRVALEETDYTELGHQLQTFRDELRVDYRLDVIDVEDPSAGLWVPPDSIWVDAQEVWSHVLMEVMDAYIYAAAIRAGADVFITSDNSLRDALDRLRKPDSDWAGLASSLKEALGLESNAELPQPLKLTSELPPSPS